MIKKHPPCVIFVANELGAFRHHREHLAEAVLAYGANVIFYANPVGDLPSSRYSFRPVKIERFRLHPVADFILFAKIFNVLRRDRPSVLHLINLKPYLFGGLAARLTRLAGWNGRLVVTVPGLGRLYGHVPAYSRWAQFRRRLVEQVLRFALRHAQVTFETEHDRDVWLKNGLITPRQAIVVNGTGLNLDSFSDCSQMRDNDELNVLFAGRLLRQKGLDIFLRAAEILDSEGIKLQVAGFIEKDPDAFPLDDIKNAPNITFLGAVKDMPGLLAQSDIVVLPSRYNEGIPRILIEAAASGSALIATEFPGSKALIVHGKTGFFLREMDLDAQAKELAALIITLKNDSELRRSIGKQAAKRVLEGGFRDTDIADCFLSLYGLNQQRS